MDREENGISQNKTASLTKADYTFDAVYFENIEKIGAFPKITNLKNAIKQNNQQETRDCTTILKNQHPQLFKFMKLHKENFDDFFKLDNNALLTLPDNKNEV